MKWTTAGGLLALLLGVAGCARDRGVQAAEGQKARGVKVEAAQVRDVRRQVDVIGTLAAREEVVVSAEVAGRVSRLVHDLGDRVAAGAPLLELDPEKLQYRAEGQRATLDQARARYGASGAGDLPPLDKVPTVASTIAQLENAQQQLDRAKNLASRNLLSRSDLETAQTRLDTAKAAYDQALASARQLRADIEAQSSSLRLAQRELRDAVIRAPFDAHVMPTIFERVNHSHIFIQLKPFGERKVTQEEVAADVRKIMVAHPSYKPTIVMRTPIGGGETASYPIQLNFTGPDLRQLSGYALNLIGDVQAMPFISDSKAIVNLSNPELRVAVDRQRAADLGVRISDLARALRLMVSGQDEISSYREKGERYPVTIRVREDQRSDMRSIGGLMVPSARGEPVRVDNVATLERGFGPTIIQRFNRQFSMAIFADVKPGQPLDLALKTIGAKARALNLPPGYSFKFSGQSKLLDETTNNMVVALALASIFIYIVLAMQFESFVQPLVIMTVLPLSVPFALFTLWMTGRVLNLWSALGILLLLGIVKKNSILQVDYTNVLRRQGMPLREALVQASETRLRPILMTTAAIVAGLIPTALGVGAGASQRADIAVTIVGGQSLCLFLTLLLVPVSYSLAEEGVERAKNLRRARRTGVAEA